MAKHAEFINGYINGTAITNIYQTVLTTAQDLDNIFIANSCDQHLWLSLPQENNSVDILLLAGCSFAYDAWTNNKRIAAGSFQVKYYSLPPTIGVVSVIGVL